MGLLSKLFGPKVDFAALVKSGATIVDVRTPEEFKRGHIKGAVNIPLQNLHNQFNRLNKEKTIIVDLAGNTSKFGKIEDLELKKTGTTWNVFTGEKQLTNVNLKYLGYGKPPVKKEVAFTDMEITFGNFAGKVISEAPDWWLSWAADNLNNRKELVDNIKLFFNQRKNQR